MKRPSFQFYPGDWQHDAALHSCSVAARGLWVEMLCIMHQAEPYGFLVLNGNPIDPTQLARIIGGTEREISRWLAELDTAGVYSRNEKGLLYSRRMVRDEQLRTIRAEAGKLGGNPILLGRKVNQIQTIQDKVETTPSSSSSSSTSKAVNRGRKSASNGNGENPWFKSDEGIEAKGKEAGIPARPGESFQDWKRRIFDAINAKGQM